MARLREQARVVRLIKDCPQDLRKYSRGVTEQGAVKYFMAHKLFNSDKDENAIKALEGHNRDKRQRNIEALVKACEVGTGDGFIQPVRQEREVVDTVRAASASLLAHKYGEGAPMTTITYDDGYYVTSDGEDLLRFWGFVAIGWKKYSAPAIFFAGVLTAILLILLGLLVYFFPAIAVFVNAAFSYVGR